MKPVVYTLFAIGMLAIASCKEDEEVIKELAQNTWTFTLGDGYSSDKTDTYEMESIVLNIQGYGQMYAQSKSRYIYDGGGTGSSITLYFKGIPLADKAYKITSLERIATHDDEVAIGALIAGHAAIPESGGGGVTLMSEGDGSQILSYQFAGGKGSAQFKDVKVWMGHPTARKSAIVSAKISQ